MDDFVRRLRAIRQSHERTERLMERLAGRPGVSWLRQLRWPRRRSLQAALHEAATARRNRYWRSSAKKALT